LANFDLKQYARRGAEARMVELNAELAQIYRAFPDLRRRRASAGQVDAASGMRQARRRRRPQMTPAQKKAVSIRMKKYWAERRKAQGK
jgi:hypothetical protein